MENKEIEGIDFKSLLTIPSLQRSILRAGEDGLERIVTRVNVMEVPDIINWVRPKEFLITAGYSFKENPDAFLDLIPKLVDHGVSALGIKTKRFLQCVPQGAINIANDYNFPIIELAEDTSFSDVVRQVMERILFRESKDLSVLQMRVHIFTNAILNGAQLKELVLLLGDMMKNPIILIDLSSNVLISSEFMNDNLKSLITGFIENRRHQDTTGDYYEKQNINFFSVPIPGRPVNLSYLILIQKKHDLSFIDKLTLERISFLLGIEIKNSEAQHLVETKYVNEFLYDLLVGKISNLSDIKLKAQACGVALPEKSQYVVIVLNWGKEELSIDKLKLIRSEMIHETFYNSIKPLITVIDDQIAMIIQHENLSKNNIKKFLIKILIVNQKSVQFCVGKTVSTIQQIASSYQEAKQIKHISNICHFDHSILDLSMLGPYRLLYLLEGHKDTQHYVCEYIKPLVEYDSNKKIDILSTLQVFFNNNGNLREASKELFIHYNTLVYRLKKIESILEINLDDSDSRLQLQLALKLYEIR